MNKAEFDRAWALTMRALRKFSRGRIDDSELEDAGQEILGSVFTRQPKEVRIQAISAYISRAARNRVMNLLEKKRRRKTDQGESLLDIQPAAAERNESVLALLEETRPRDLEFVEKAVGLIDILYRLRVAPGDPKHTRLICVERTLNALVEARRKIQDVMFDRKDLSPIGLDSFRQDYGNEIFRYLQDRISDLFLSVQNIQAIPRMLSFPDFVLDAIPRLREDPVMLILRVLYKKFRVGSGRHGTRELIGKLILELKQREDASKPKLTDVFSSVSQSTNFETLRKKVYRKGADPIYDKLATWILETCEATE